ncbi:succinate--CoA ligase subunit beta [Sciscionella marina]|uniref:succinate--CoA ligase subunit beta n=1 Tax=Sciscionella marina TaxID=508770 RepID=UPI00036CEE7D|nr:ATP-grasp domain-containing protein [Sciscionella marina]
MQLLEYEGKQLLSRAGVRTPDGATVSDPGEAATIAAALGNQVVVKAQVPAGKRGKAGAVRFADSPGEARDAAAELLGRVVGGFTVGEVLVERAAAITGELYAAILNDPASKGPLLLFSTEGGMDIEEVNARNPERVRRLPVDIRAGLSQAAVENLLADSEVPAAAREPLAETLVTLYGLYREADAELVEINPLALTENGGILALDAKIALDPGALARHQGTLPRRSGTGPAATETGLERQARELGLQFIELGGSVGVLSNGAGLTMTTLDAVHHYGGSPANFLEIGGDAYTKAVPALRLVLGNPNVRSLLVNFCGAFARTDVMTEGVLDAIEELRPGIPISFSIHGTGEAEAIAMVRDRLRVEPYEHMDDAVRAAVAAAS